MMILSIIVYILLFLPILAQASVLSTAAAALSAGQWSSTITTSNFNGGDILRPGPGTWGSTLEFNDKQIWNPVAGTVMSLGGSHPNVSVPNGSNTTLFGRYVESTNTWDNTALANPAPAFDDAFVTASGGIDSIGHAYQHNTINPHTGDFYHRQYGSGKMMKFSQATQSWSQCTVRPGSSQVAGALEYFPDRNSLIFYDGDWGVYELSLLPGNCLGSWVQRASTNAGGFSPQITGISSYHNQSAYSRRCHCMLFVGQTSTTMWKMNADGTFAQVANAPQIPGIPQGGGGAIFTVDPVTGYILMWHNSNAATTMYQYDSTADSWSTITRVSPIFPGPEGGVTETVAIPISTYGVIMFVQVSSSAGGTAQVRLYKHTASTAADLDFAARCNGGGVIRCFGFDSNGELGTTGSAAFGSNFGAFNNSVSNCPTTGPSQCPIIDGAVVASGTGALKFTVPTLSGAGGSGQFFTNFSGDLADIFRSGQTFYIQVRERFSCDFLFTNCPVGTGIRVYQGSGGWKTVDISTGDRAGVCQPNGTGCATSCTELEIVMQNTFSRGFLQGYHGCPGTYQGSSLPFEEPFNGTDFKLQNAYSLFCPYSEVSVGNISDCWPYVKDEWLTAKARVTIGTFVAGGVGACATFPQGCYPNSTVEYWLGRNGQPLVKTHSFVITLNASSDGAQADGWGKVWLLPYNTGKDATQSTPEAYVYYDELIVSTQDIADPGGTVPSGTPFIVNIGSGKTLTVGSGKVMRSGTH